MTQNLNRDLTMAAHIISYAALLMLNYMLHFPGFNIQQFVNKTALHAHSRHSLWEATYRCCCCYSQTHHPSWWQMKPDAN